MVRSVPIVIKTVRLSVDARKRADSWVCAPPVRAHGENRPHAAACSVRRESALAALKSAAKARGMHGTQTEQGDGAHCRREGGSVECNGGRLTYTRHRERAEPSSESGRYETRGVSPSKLGVPLLPQHRRHKSSFTNKTQTVHLTISPNTHDSPVQTPALV